jgi:twitching motility protein PilT
MNQAALSSARQHLDRLLAAAPDYVASDLHLVAGVPPAYRVNGEIIIAEEDVLASPDIANMAMSLLTAEQQQKFEGEWELCIAFLHETAGRVRATLYRRNGNPEACFRFCGERIPAREELGLPERMDDLSRKPARARPPR